MSVEATVEGERGVVGGLRRFFPVAFTFIGLIAYFVVGALPERSGVFPGYVFEAVVWCALLAVLIWRDPQRSVRLSNPLLPVLVVFANFFILPAASWAHGANLETQWHHLGRLRVDTVNHIQYLHALLMGAFGAAYFVVGPRVFPAPVEVSERAYPKVRALLIFGLIVPAITVVSRVATTGHILPQKSYGAGWQGAHLVVEGDRDFGGASYVIDQVISKVWLYPMMALGIGSGVVLARLIAAKRYRAIALASLVPAALIVLIGGARSGVALTFFVSLCVADWLVGPLKWRWLAALAFAGLLFFNLFGVYRSVQDRPLDEAIALTVEGYQERRDTDSGSAEGLNMLLKEHYGVTFVDATGMQLGAEHVVQQLLWVFPTQVIPEKRNWFSVSVWLTRELLSEQAVRAGGGVAGAMTVDGYLIAGELGEVVLGLLLGSIFGLALRVLLIPERRIGGVPLWRVMLVMTLAHHSIVFARADLGSLVVEVLYFIVVPVVMIQAIRGLWRDDDPWVQPVKLLRA